jgi:hypothetical protein
VAHERSDVNVRGVLLFSIGLVVVTAVVQLAMWLFLQLLSNRERESDTPRRAVAAAERQRPPEPRLEALSAPAAAFGFEDAQTLRRFRETEEAALASYGWINRNLGTVRIPVERAMDLIAERGIPPALAPAPAPAVPATPAAPSGPVPVQP